MQTIDFPLPILIGGIVGGALGAAAVGIFHLSIMPAVNASLPKDARVAIYDTDRNLFFVLRKHKELYPASKPRSAMYGLLIAAGGVLFTALLMAWAQALAESFFKN
jgi:hypothetical protein